MSTPSIDLAGEHVGDLFLGGHAAGRRIGRYGFDLGAALQQQRIVGPEAGGGQGGLFAFDGEVELAVAGLGGADVGGGGAVVENSMTECTRDGVGQVPQAGSTLMPRTRAGVRGMALSRVSSWWTPCCQRCMWGESW